MPLNPQWPDLALTGDMIRCVIVSNLELRTLFLFFSFFFHCPGALDPRFPNIVFSHLEMAVTSDGTLCPACSRAVSKSSISCTFLSLRRLSILSASLSEASLLADIDILLEVIVPDLTLKYARALKYTSQLELILGHSKPCFTY